MHHCIINQSVCQQLYAKQNVATACVPTQQGNDHGPQLLRVSGFAGTRKIQNTTACGTLSILPRKLKRMVGWGFRVEGLGFRVQGLGFRDLYR